MSTADFIRSVPLFAGIDAKDLDAGLVVFRPVRFAAGECLVTQLGWIFSASAFKLRSNTGSEVEA